MTIRWSEHVRALHRQSTGKLAPEKQRRRYAELAESHCTDCLDCLIVDTCSSAEIHTAEAKAIILVNPRSNGSELKHFAETFRPKRTKPRNTPNGPRARRSKSVRTRARLAQLQQKDDQWVAEINQLNLQLKENVDADIV